MSRYFLMIFTSIGLLFAGCSFLDYSSIPVSKQSVCFPTFHVLGQQTLATGDANHGGLSSSSLSGPGVPGCNGDHFWSADFSNNRILIWKRLPTTDFQGADLVLGQLDMMSGAVNAGAAVNARSLNQPAAAVEWNNHFIVSDYHNNRVLIWNTFPTTNFQPADVVLGQPDFTTSDANHGGLSASSLNLPYSGLIVVDGRLVISDYFNNRILIWNSIPTVNNQPADLVLGQASFTTNDANHGGLSAQSLSTPSALHWDGSRLYVNDFNNYRILIWNGFPTANFQPADLVLGQPNMTTNTFLSPPTAQSIACAEGINSDGVRLYVTDSCNSRILIWNTLPRQNAQAADRVFGQPNFISKVPTNGGISGQSMGYGYGISGNGQTMFFGDYDNNRILNVPLP